MVRTITPFFYTLLLTFAFTIFNTTNVVAQDAHFSQFHAAPLQINPAMAGVYEGQYRVGINYRDQWGSVFGPVSYQTYAVNFDFRFYALKEDYMAIGLSLVGDKAGEARYSMTQGHFTFSFMKKVMGGRGYRSDQYLIGGAQLGFGQQGINWNSLRFSRQFDGQAFNPTLPSGELVGDQSEMYADLNAGLMWYGLFGEGASAYGGVSFHHLNSPDISFYGDVAENLYLKYTVHGGGEIPLSREIAILPSALVQRQGPSTMVVAGSAVRFTNRDWDDIALRVGAYGRVSGRTGGGTTTDAIITTAALEYDTWVLGISYDTNVSSLDAVSGGRGAFEMSLYYTHPAPRRGGLYCPTF